jgi:hypothetical protein
MFPNSYTHICERFVYFQDQSVYFAAEKYVDWSWDYINGSQTHECGKLGLRPRNSQNRNTSMEFSWQCISSSVYHGMSGLLIKGTNSTPCKVANYTDKILDKQLLTSSGRQKRMAKKDQRVFIPGFQLWNLTFWKFWDKFRTNRIHFFELSSPKTTFQLILLVHVQRLRFSLLLELAPNLTPLLAIKDKSCICHQKEERPRERERE